MAMWVWDVRHVRDPAARDELLDFCQARGISTLYLNAFSLTPAYRAFNRAAHARGIAVHALGGDPRWALPRYHPLPLAWAASVAAFNDQGQPDERFDGIHTDIEPYFLSRQWAEHPARVLGGLLDLHAKLAEHVSTHRPLQLGVDVPFWFDDDPAYLIEWRGRVLPPSHHLLDVADFQTVMAYRNYAEGAEGVIELSRREIAYGERVGKLVVIGQETQADLTPVYITYGGMSADYWWGEISKLIAAFGGRRSFGGIAVHHYESYKELVG